MQLFVIAGGIVSLFGALLFLYFAMLSSVDDKDRQKNGLRTSAISWRTVALYAASLFFVVLALALFGAPIVERASIMGIVLFGVVAVIVFAAVRRIFMSTARYAETLSRPYD